MSEKHLLVCDCGAEHDVAPRNAGESLECECGVRLRIPTLRELRRLPLASRSAAPPPNRGWTLGHGVVFAIVLPVLLGCIGIIGRAQYIRSNLPKGQPTLEQVLREHPDPLIRSDVDNMTPWQTIQDVWQPYQKISALTRFPPLHIRVQELDAQMRRRMLYAGIVAGIAAILLGGTLFSGRPGKPSGRSTS